MEQILSLATLLLPIITAVTQVIKRSISMPKRLVPICALVVGLLLGLAAIPLTDLDWLTRAWGGGLAGLSSTGFYEMAFNQKTGRTK